MELLVRKEERIEFARFIFWDKPSAGGKTGDSRGMKWCSSEKHEAKTRRPKNEVEGSQKWVR
ncbi:hypothetical protein D7Z54_04820 [Salibacterium salarium]|uniref:Uncharacterized protein n=1 Tax=Salibacterium salarium TaxID=284579 RepID=A0A3R9P7I6_9BACI|nr:hypothetical protein D7Z54_04820 [Salibacterium salarium]